MFVRVIQEEFGMGQVTIYNVKYDCHSRNPLVHNLFWLRGVLVYIDSANQTNNKNNINSPIMLPFS